MKIETYIPKDRSISLVEIAELIGKEKTEP